MLVKLTLVKSRNGIRLVRPFARSKLAFTKSCVGRSASLEVPPSLMLKRHGIYASNQSSTSCVGEERREKQVRSTTEAG